MQTKIKTTEEIKNIRISGQILNNVLNRIITSTSAGMSTKDLADIADEELRKANCKSVFYNYHGFPSSLCVSLNEEVIHGIPKANKIIKDGDIVSIDFGVNYKGMITDAARTYVVGNTNSANKLLIAKTEQALFAGISVVKSSTKIGDISVAIENILKSSKLGIVREYVGHGVGHELHEEPNIPNYGTEGTGFTLQEGMTIAIEPMATLGRDEVRVATDGWTVYTADGSKSAHFEDTVLVTKNGYEILTRPTE
jgi:methionyl aminopeptidase